MPPSLREETNRGRNKSGPSLVNSFFFQAEDGIRDWSVTGVQTCSSDLDEIRLQDLPQPAGDPEDEFHRTGPQGEGNGGRNVLRSRSAGGLHSVQLLAAQDFD